jgi:hypothetical protein
MDKWEKLHIAPIQTMLGLVIDTNRMTVSVPDDYIQSVCMLIDSTWHTHCQRFTVKEAQELTGKLGHLAEGANWVFHLLTHIYASIAYALSQNKRFLAESSPEFQTLIKSLWSGYFFCNVKGQIRHISFAIKRSAKLAHQSRCQYNITKSMRQEIEFFRKKLLPNSKIRWESLIVHIIPRMPTFITFAYIDETFFSFTPYYPIIINWFPSHSAFEATHHRLLVISIYPTQQHRQPLQPPHPILPAAKLGTLLLGILPLGRRVQSRPFKPLSCRLAPQPVILDKLSHETNGQNEAQSLVHSCLMHVPKLKSLSIR